MKLEQVFYGRGPKGYAILGSSLPDCGLTDCVRDLCGAVGTPGAERPGDDVPFLLQKHLGSSLVMVCGRKGEPDSLGRGTLLFHALIANLKDARQYNVSALSLYNGGMFAETPISGRIECLEWEGESGVHWNNECSLALPAAVKCHRSENFESLEQLGGKLSELNWASFSWKPLSDFDYQAVDVSCSVVLIPRDVNVYDARGTLLRTAAMIGDSDGRQSAVPASGESISRSKHLVLKTMVAAILIGLGFAAGLIVGDGNGALRDSTKTIRAPIRPTFDERFRIADFEEGIKKICLPRYRSGEFVNKLRAYVDFVNREFMVSTNQKGEK